MSADVSNNNVSSAPWSGFWYDLMSFIRCNIVFFFSIFWIGITGINIYIKVLFLCISFVLDRIAVRKAEDAAIRTVDDFKLYAERKLTEENSNRRVQRLRQYAKSFYLAFCSLVLMESLVHLSAILSGAAEWRDNVVIYEIAGVSYFYILSAHLLGAGITNEKLKYAHAWNRDRWFGVRTILTWRWVQPINMTMIVVIAILLSRIINRAEHNSGLFDYVKHGLAFFLLAMALHLYAVLPMTFKGAAYANYLGQKAKT